MLLKYADSEDAYSFKMGFPNSDILFQETVCYTAWRLHETTAWRWIWLILTVIQHSLCMISLLSTQKMTVSDWR